MILIFIQNLELDQLKQELLKSESYRSDLQSKYDSLLSNVNTAENSISQFDNENSSTKSGSPENFEVIDKPDRHDSPKCKSRGSIVTLDDDCSASFNENENDNDTDWTRVGLSLETSDQSNVGTEKDSDTKSQEPKEEIPLPKSQSFR